VEIVKSVAVVK